MTTNLYFKCQKYSPIWLFRVQKSPKLSKNNFRHWLTKVWLKDMTKKGIPNERWDQTHAFPIVFGIFFLWSTLYKTIWLKASLSISVNFVLIELVLCNYIWSKKLLDALPYITYVLYIEIYYQKKMLCMVMHLVAFLTRYKYIILIQ